MATKISVPQTAMILAAGLGKRMRPVTNMIPKPLIPIADKPLIDWGLDALAAAGTTKIVVNVHYFADQIETHLKAYPHLEIIISDERNQLLGSAGGIIKALPHLGKESFFILNADTFWIDSEGSNLHRLATQWNDSRMDILLMIAMFNQATGYAGHGDFLADEEGRLVRCRESTSSPFLYAGVGIIHPRIFRPRIFKNDHRGAESLNFYFDRAIEAGRLYGMLMDGSWFTVGTPNAIGEVEAALAEKI